MNILHLVGMPYPTKYGNLEKWFVEICRQAFSLGHRVFIAYDLSPGEVRIYSDDISRCGGTLIAIAGDAEIESFCQREKIEAVHFHFGFSGFKPLHRRLYKKGIQLYVHLHGECYYIANREWKKHLAMRIRIAGHRIKTHIYLRYYKKFMGCSQAVTAQYKYFYRIPDRKASTLYIGIDKAQEIHKHIENDIPVIVCTAFHSPVKGVDVLLDALAILKKKSIAFHLIQIGGGVSELNGEDTLALKKRCNDYGLAESVHWTGVINNVGDYLQKADIYCQPSRTEGISLSIAEAMQYGLPIVASNIGGIPELVHDTKNGYLTIPENAVDLAEKLENLISNPILRRKMGLRSSEILNQLEFSQTKSAESLFRIYSQ